MNKIFWKIIYQLKGILLGIKGMRRIQLGSKVYYDNDWWFVSNWANQPYMDLCKKSEYRRHVPKEHIKPSKSLAEYYHRFKVMRNWYMGYWYRIDVERHTLNY